MEPRPIEILDWDKDSLIDGRVTKKKVVGKGVLIGWGQDFTEFDYGAGTYSNELHAEINY